MRNLRIFWTSSLIEEGNGFYYYKWNNWLTKKSAQVFAGYNKRALRGKEGTFKDALELMK